MTVRAIDDREAEQDICPRLRVHRSARHGYRCAMMPATGQSVYEASGGRSGLEGLASAWHRRVMADEVVSHAFSHGFHPDHHARLAAYWAEALVSTPGES